jgi:hypothetical protein
MIPYVSEGSVEGNAEVIALLERWIARAKLGQINYIALAAAEGPIHVYHDFAGLRGMEFAANWGLDVLKTRIMNQQATLDPPLQDKSVPADRFIWLATRGPACFDFFAWLVMAEMTRLREKAPGPLRVGFYWGKDGSMERILQTAGRRQMYRNVIIPSLAFVGAVEDATCIEHGRVMERYTFVDIVRACRLGEDVPLFTPSAEAMAAVRDLIYPTGPTTKFRQPPVTITLREAAYSSHRNSNLDEWLKFAEYLQAQGERVIFVRDTSHAMDNITGHETCPAASVDIDIRLALYESAKANLFVSNGPWSLALFGTAPWLMFNQIDAMDPYPPNTAQWWTQFHGISPGEQFPWSRPDQRIIWERDTFGNMSKAWEQLEPLLSIRQAAE